MSTDVNTIIIIMQIEELLKHARTAMENSYKPYSRLAVGAALRTKDGMVFTGANIENASLGLSICAERVAVFKAVSEGHRSFTELGIVSSSNTPAFPCGACRQVLQEFSPHVIVYVQGKENRGFTLTELIPYPFESNVFANSK